MHMLLCSQAHDRANGCEKQTNKNTKKAKQDQTGTLGEGSQGGVFTNSNTSQTTNTSQATNNPLGVQPLSFNTKNKSQVTNLKNLELARKKRESRLKQKPVWKL